MIRATEEVDMKLRTVAPSQAVVERVAALEGVDHTELDPLFSVIDPEALDTLVGMTGRSGSAIQIELTYHGHDVTVTGDGGVHIDEDVAFDS